MEGWLRLVKIFVVVAGIVLVLGTTALIVLLVRRAGTPPVDLAKPETLALPPGMRLTGVSGGTETLILQLKDGTGVVHLYAVDVRRGRPVAFWRVEEAP